MLSPRPTPRLPVTPLLLADRLLTLAQQADTAGLADTAGRLVTLAHSVLDERSAGASSRR